MGDRWKRLLDRQTRALGQLLARLSPSQKLSLLILAASSAVGLIVVVSIGSGEEYRKIAEGSPSALGRLHVAYANGEIRSEVRPDGLYVPSSQADAAQAQGIFAGFHDDPSLRWVFQKPDWGVTDEDKRMRWVVSTQHRLAQGIRSHADIETARVFLNLNPDRRKLVIGSERPETASVMVGLRSSVARLRPDAVRGIRSLVADATGIRRENVSVTDSRHHAYPSDDPGLGGVDDEREQRVAREFEKKVEKLLLGPFKPGQFVHVVSVKLDQTYSEKQNVHYNPDKSMKLERENVEEKTTRSRPLDGGVVGVAAQVTPDAGGVGVAPAVAKAATKTAGGTSVPAETESKTRTESKSEVGLATETEKIRIPPGAVEAVTVTVKIDKGAAKENLEEIKSLGAESAPKDLEEYRTAIEQDVKNVVSIGTPEISRVTVTFDVLQTGPMQAMMMPSFGERLVAWASDHTREAILGILALVALLTIANLVRRSIPTALEIPALEGLEGIEGGRAAAAGRTPRAKPVEALRESLTARPDLAAQVVRLWVSDHMAPDEEGAR